MKAGPCPLLRDIHIHSVISKTLIKNFLYARNRAVKRVDKANSSPGITLYCGKKQGRNKIISDTDKYLEFRMPEGEVGLRDSFQGLVEEACLRR